MVAFDLDILSALKLGVKIDMIGFLLSKHGTLHMVAIIFIDVIQMLKYCCSGFLLFEVSMLLWVFFVQMALFI